MFIPHVGITGDAFGVVPYGDGWYRAYITTTFGFGFSQLLDTSIILLVQQVHKVGQVMDLWYMFGVLNLIRVLLILILQ